MADPTLKIAISADRTSAVLEFATDGSGRPLTVSAEALSEIIQGLTTARAALDPPVPPTSKDVPMPLVGRIQAVVPAERVGGKRIIGIRHPGFGWMAFELEGTDTADLAGAFIDGLRADRDAGTL